MRQPSLTAERAKLLGAGMDLVTAGQVLDFVALAAEREARAVVANHNLHSVHLTKVSREMAAFYRSADLVEIDSTPLIWWARLMGLPASYANRCTYLDWREDFWRRASENGWRVYYLGGRPGVADKAARLLMDRWPGVIIETHHGYFDKRPGSWENRAVLDQINVFRPHVLLVGMGMPVQELWAARNLDALVSGVVMTVGAAFDYEAGVQKAAPRILGRLGVEWLYRLLHDPKRLFTRYLVEPWTLVPALMIDLVRLAFARSGLQLQPRALDPAPAPQEAPILA